MRALVGKQELRERRLNDYTYDVERVEDELDGQGRVKDRESRRYEIFFVRGKPVRRLVAEDGRALSPKDQTREDEKVREKVEAIAGNAVVSEMPGVRLSAILQRFDFRAVGRELLQGRPALVFQFQPLPGKRDLDSDHVLRALTGRLWVDEAEREVVRATVRNAGSIKWGLGLGASVKELEMRMEFRKVDDTVWLPLRDETIVRGRLLLLKGFHRRITRTYGRYRRFEVQSEEAVGPQG